MCVLIGKNVFQNSEECKNWRIIERPNLYDYVPNLGNLKRYFGFHTPSLSNSIVLACGLVKIILESSLIMKMSFEIYYLILGECPTY